MRSVTTILASYRPSCIMLLLGAAIGCSGEAGASRGAATNSSTPRSVRAVVMVAGDRPVRWISRKPQCVVPFDAPTLDDCVRQEAARHNDALITQVRAAVKAGEDARGIACLRMSREIASGDSTLIAIGTIGAAEVDGFAESSSRWVWFRRSALGDTVWTAPSEPSGVSDVAPIRTETGC